MANNIAEIIDVQKIFKGNNEPAIKSISAIIKAGEITGLVGPDGAGKTTLIRMLTSLLLPSKGNIIISNYNTKKDSKHISNLTGYMPQKFGLYEDLTVIENLRLYADLRGIKGKEKEESFKKLLKFTDLESFTGRLAGKLSGGMKQKLGLACALLSKPQFLLLDEPSVGVDPISRRELWAMTKELIDEGISVLWSTAYLDEAEKCDSVILLNDGNLLFHGLPGDLTGQIANQVFQIQGVTENNRTVLRNVLNHENIIDGVIQGQHIRIVVNKDCKTPDLNVLKDQKGIHIIPVTPRFEDAFINILGGGPGGNSILADSMLPLDLKEDIVIKAQNLTKIYGNFIAANNISFNIKKGEIFGLLGPNGAGKSTTFKMMCGLTQATTGEASIMGIDLKKAAGQARSNLGYMAQKFSLYGNLTVMQNLKFYSGIYGLKGRKQKQIIDKMIEIFKFDKLLQYNADSLPLGFKQRLALSCAVMHNPPILFLDEPTSGVDPITRREFWTHINNLVEKGVTVMVTTHFMDEAEYCDRISLIYRGKSIATGTPGDLKQQFISPDNPDPTMEDTFIALIENSDDISREVA